MIQHISGWSEDVIYNNTFQDYFATYENYHLQQ